MSNSSEAEFLYRDKCTQNKNRQKQKWNFKNRKLQNVFACPNRSFHVFSECTHHGVITELEQCFPEGQTPWELVNMQTVIHLAWEEPGILHFPGDANGIVLGTTPYIASILLSKIFLSHWDLDAWVEQINMASSVILEWFALSHALLFPGGLSGMCMTFTASLNDCPSEKNKKWRATRQGKSLLTLHFSWPLRSNYLFFFLWRDSRNPVSPVSRLNAGCFPRAVSFQVWL